jgi:general secretion pathway protein A
LRIAGSNGDAVFEPEAVAALFRYSLGVPRVINLLCEHCLVSAFVDQKKTVSAEIVDAVAKDFDLGDGITGAAMTAPAVPPPAPERFDLVEALRTLATLADKIRQSEQELPKERKL